MEKILQTMTTYHAGAWGVARGWGGGVGIGLYSEYKPDSPRESQSIE